MKKFFLPPFSILPGICAVLLTLTINACSSKLTLADLKTTLDMYDVNQLPTQGDYPDADAVIIIDETDTQVIAGRSDLYTLETHHIVKKLLRNINDEATVNIYVGEDEELVDITARTIRTDGSIVDLKPADFYTLSGIAGMGIIYANIKTIRFTFPAAEKDGIIEYKYQKKKSQPFVSDVWRIQNDLPTLRNQYALTVPLIIQIMLPYRYKVYPQSIEMTPTVVLNSSRFQSVYTNPITFIWARGDIPAFKQEERMPPPESYRAQMRFALSSWDDWNGIAGWYYSYFFKPQLIISDSVRALAHRLTAACTSDSEKIKQIYNHVRQLRYVAVQLGESGLRPSTPQEILRHNYGDCKDKSTLCIAMLKSIGITAYPVLVLTGNTGRFDPSYPSWSFNHMIVKAVAGNSAVYWMDPTSEYSRFLSLPWEVQNIPVLTLNSDSTGTIETTPGSSGAENFSDISLYTDVLENGSALVRVKIKNTGEEGRYFREMMSEKGYTEIKEACQKMIANEAVQSSIDTIIVENLKDLDSPLTLNIHFTVPNALQRQNDIALFSVHVFKVIDDLRWTAKETRKYPIWFPFSSSTVRNSIIRFSDSTLSLRPLPGSVSIRNAYGTYENSFEQPSMNTVVIKEKLTMKKSEVPSQDYRIIKGFFERVKVNSEQAVVLEKKKNSR